MGQLAGGVCESAAEHVQKSVTCTVTPPPHGRAVAVTNVGASRGRQFITVLPLISGSSVNDSKRIISLGNVRTEASLKSSGASAFGRLPVD